MCMHKRKRYLILHWAPPEDFEITGAFGCDLNTLVDFLEILALSPVPLPNNFLPRERLSPHFQWTELIFETFSSGTLMSACCMTKLTLAVSMRTLHRPHLSSFSRSRHSSVLLVGAEA